MNIPLTIQRRLILEKLSETEGHLMAEDIYTLVKETIPRISLGTVYRNLAVLEKIGLIEKLEIQNQPALYEKKKDLHYHLICENCGLVEDLRGVRIDQLEDEIAQLSGYKISGHRLEVFGVCKDCQSDKSI